jgi:hypothetical protein
MERNYTDDTKPQTVARYLGIRRLGKSGLAWGIEVLEREYANMEPDDTDFSKDTAGFSTTIGAGDMTDEYPVVDPVTLEPTEGQTATIGQLFALVQSYYIHEARKRDAAKTLLEE